MSDAAENVEFDETPAEQPTAEKPADDFGDVTEDFDTSDGPSEAPEPEQPAKIEFTPEQQVFINEKIIAEKVAKQREAERKAQELEQKLQEMQAKIPEPARPNIPPPPDPFDDDYDAKIKARDDALLEAAKYDAMQEAQALQERHRQEQILQQQMEQQLNTVKTYSQRAEKLGIDASKLQSAGNRLAQHGISEDVAKFILEDEHGPNVTVYLAENLMELEQIKAMDPIRAAIYIENNVKAKANARMNTSPPPEPTESLEGKSFPSSRGPEGVTYE